jgi:hypothetical protein
VPNITEYAEIYESWQGKEAHWISWGWVPGSGKTYDVLEGRFGMQWVNELARSGWRVVGRTASQAADSGPGYGFERSQHIWTLARSRDADGTPPADG